VLLVLGLVLVRLGVTGPDARHVRVAGAHVRRH
jgi:hypothetical protein